MKYLASINMLWKLIFLGVLCSFYSVPAYADEPENNFDWKAFSLCEPEGKNYGEYDDKLMYWAKLSKSLNDSLWNLYAYDKKTGEKEITSLIQGFGEHGFDVDIRLYLMAPDIFFPTIPDLIEIHIQNPKDKEKVKTRNEIICMVSKTQVEMFLKNPKKFDRYYKSLVHSGLLFGGKFAHIANLHKKSIQLKENFKKDSPDYWVQARAFMVLVHATGQDELLKGVKPTELHSKLATWLAWMGKYEKRLIGHPTKPIWIVTNNVFPLLIHMEVDPLTVPRYPFDDWNPRLKPIPPSFYFSS